MYAIYAFEARAFIEETRYLFSNPVEFPDTFIPSSDLHAWYDWVIGFILTKELSLPIVGNHTGTRSATMEYIYRAVERELRSAFSHVISPEELLKIPTYGQLKYVFNGNQLFLFSCSPV